jgi:hypothetical protein
MALSLMRNVIGGENGENLCLAIVIRLITGAQITSSVDAYIVK